MIWIFGGFLAVLVIVHMARPRYLRREISSVRFFMQMPQPKQTKSRLRFGKPPLTFSFIIQLFILLLLLTAVFLALTNYGSKKNKQVGVWFIVDTSASMTTQQNGKQRMAAAKLAAGTLLKQVAAEAGKQKMAVCYKLSALDMEVRDILTADETGAVSQAVEQLEPRALGTDLSLVRALPARLGRRGQENLAAAGCFVTHLVVVTDCPAPDWITRQDSVRVIWRDIGSKTASIGISAIRGVRNPLTGSVREVNIEVSKYGEAPAGTRLQVTSPEGEPVLNEILKWQDNIWQGSFKPTGPGSYRFNLTPFGAYVLDNTAVIEIEDERTIRVDWQAADDRLLKTLGWKVDNVNPHLVVTTQMPQETGTPALVVGKGYGAGSRVGEIRDFIESSPLLEDLNFDAAEMVGLHGIQLPEGFDPVLRGIDGRVWLGTGQDPLCAYVPGFPTGDDDTVGRFSAAVFFNALRWLLKERRLSPLYTLTSVYQPEPSGTRLALHQGEGNTYRDVFSYGEIGNLNPVKASGGSQPIWPLLVAFAMVLFLVERLMAVLKD